MAAEWALLLIYRNQRVLSSPMTDNGFRPPLSWSATTGGGGGVEGEKNTKIIVTASTTVGEELCIL